MEQETRTDDFRVKVRLQCRELKHIDADIMCIQEVDEKDIGSIAIKEYAVSVKYMVV